MEADEQTKQTKDFIFFPGYKLGTSNVLFAARIRCTIQDTVKRYRELLDNRYDILLYFRIILVILLCVTQNFKV